MFPQPPQSPIITMFDSVIEFIMNLICQYPGGFIRWLLFRKRSLKEYVESEWSINFGTLLLTLFLVLLLRALFF